MIVKENVKVLKNYMMVNVQILNLLDVNIVKDSSMLSVVSMVLPMITCVTCNVLESSCSVNKLVLPLKKTVNVIKDMFLFVVLIIKLTEMIV